MYERPGLHNVLIFSYDGMGNDGTFLIFEAEHSLLCRRTSALDVFTHMCLLVCVRKSPTEAPERVARALSSPQKHRINRVGSETIALGEYASTQACTVYPRAQTRTHAHTHARTYAPCASTGMDGLRPSKHAQPRVHVCRHISTSCAISWALPQSGHLSCRSIWNLHGLCSTGDPA